MSDKFLQLRNNYCCHYKSRQKGEQPPYSQRVHTETPPTIKYQSPRKLMKTTQASFFDQFKKFPIPKPTAYQTYLQSILQHKNILQAKQNFQPSFTMHNIYGQKINTFRKIKDTISKKSNHQQNKTDGKIQNHTQFNSPRKMIVTQKGRLDRIPNERLSTYNNERVSMCNYEKINIDNYDDIEPWNTSEIQQMNQ